MKLAFSKPINDKKKKNVLFTNFRCIGYDGLQLKRDQYHHYIINPERFINDWGNFPGVASGLITGGGLDEECMADLRKVFVFGKAVKSELVIFMINAPRKGLSKKDIKQFASTLSELGKEAQQFGIKLSLHHHFNSPLTYREDFDIFFDTVNNQSVGLTVDTAHLVMSGIENIGEIIRDFKHVIDNFHLKDFANSEFNILGKGRINFVSVFAAIKEIGYEGWICADEESGSDVLWAMQESLKFIKNRIEGIA